MPNELRVLSSCTCCPNEPSGFCEMPGCECPCCVMGYADVLAEDIVKAEARAAGASRAARAWKRAAKRTRHTTPLLDGSVNAIVTVLDGRSDLYVKEHGQPENPGDFIAYWRALATGVVEIGIEFGDFKVRRALADAAALRAAVAVLMGMIDSIEETCASWCTQPVNHDCCFHKARIRSLVVKAVADPAVRGVLGEVVGDAE